MAFILLTFLAAFGIEIIGSYISVLGLAAIFAADPIIMTMAVMLDFAKVMTVSFVYKKWQLMSKLMKTYMVTAAIILMIITSSGVFGYLSAQFQQAVVPNKEVAIKLQTLTDEQQRLQARKVEIDKQIANIPANIVRNRIKLIDSFKGETERINTRLTEIDAELPKLKIDSVNKSAHIGPIAYVAEAFDISMEKAVKYVIMLIIFVFDPLAVCLIIAGNFLVEERARKKEEEKNGPPARLLDSVEYTQAVADGPLRPNDLIEDVSRPGSWLNEKIESVLADSAVFRNDAPDPLENSNISIEQPSEEAKRFYDAMNKNPHGYVDLAGARHPTPTFNTLDEEYQPQHRPDWKEQTLDNTIADVNDSLADSLPDTNPWTVVPLPEDEIKAIEEITAEPEEPQSRIRTERQLDKLAKSVIPEVAEEIIPHELFETKTNMFTSAPQDDKINNLKGVMASAETNHSGSEVSFEPSQSTSVQKYSN